MLLDSKYNPVKTSKQEMHIGKCGLNTGATNACLDSQNGPTSLHVSGKLARSKPEANDKHAISRAQADQEQPTGKLQASEHSASEQSSTHHQTNNEQGASKLLGNKGKHKQNNRQTQQTSKRPANK